MKTITKTKILFSLISVFMMTFISSTLYAAGLLTPSGGSLPVKKIDQ